MSEERVAEEANFFCVSGMFSNSEVPSLKGLPSFIQGTTLTAGKRGEVCCVEASKDCIAHYRGGSKAIIFTRPEWGNFDTLSTRLQLVLDFMGRLGWAVTSTETNPHPHDGGPHHSQDKSLPMWRQITLQMT